MEKKLLFILVFMVGLFSVSAQNEKEKKLLLTYNYQEKITYKIINGDTLDMVLFYPKNKLKEKYPLMLYTHGGGWGGGNKFNIFRSSFKETLNILLENEIACATIEYRLTQTGESTAYDCVVDCKDAARFLIKNAEKYFIDTEHMGVWGGSAGGHLSLMTAYGDNRNFVGEKSLRRYNPTFLCVTSYFPLTSFTKTEYLKGTNFENPKRFIPILGGLLNDKKNLAKSLSPAELLHSNSTPALLLHGDKDEILPLAQSTYLKKVADEVGADVKIVVVKNAGHSFSGNNISPTITQVNKIAADFIINKLVKQKELQ